MAKSLEPPHISVDQLLSPAQEEVCQAALALLQPGSVISVVAGGRWRHLRGMGITTVLKEMRNRTGGAYIDIEDLYEITRLRHPRYFEQSLYEAIRRQLDRHDTIYIDQPGAMLGSKARVKVLETVLRYVGDAARDTGKRVVTIGGAPPGNLVVVMRELETEDYAHIMRRRLGPEAVADINFGRLHEMAPKLNAIDLTRLCDTLSTRVKNRLTMQDVAEVLSHILGSNINLDAVEPLQFENLIGFEKILRRLDQAILLPLRDPDLAKELGIQAKHGVLLHGPPGTGKTSIGRALAHRMKGRFFMIDGDHNHEQKGCFYKSTAGVFQMARQNAPSVLFIDDADIILTDPSMQHWGRYLLTMLDGLESKSASRVCVMMTAMTLEGLPQALLRSGRMDVWLETTLPTRESRVRILKGHLEKLALGSDDDAVAEAAELTEGLTPADLRSVVSSMAGFMAFDRYKAAPKLPFPAYLARAVTEIREHKALADEAASRRGVY